MAVSIKAEGVPASVGDTLRALKTPPSVFLNWQPILCATENSCESRLYEVRVALEPRLLNLTENPQLIDVGIYYTADPDFTHNDILFDGIDYYYRVYALCNEESGVPRGCSSGFWKNHPEKWARYSPSATLEEVFNLPPDLNQLGAISLMEALDFDGGPGIEGSAKLLLKQAVAAILNASHFEINFYPLCRADVINSVNAALATLNRDAMISLKNTLDYYNSNLACSL
ncbi:MAG: hypothetical protein UT37_C0002G0001 [Parcubacteria group bacterium GW2011_GWA2_39_18]|nr:MAG: hypothetical protein UT37_C0002G0001 [Parcubacteria group bacterium GW2011_GWA2_39_18]